MLDGAVEADLERRVDRDLACGRGLVVIEADIVTDHIAPVGGRFMDIKTIIADRQARDQRDWRLSRVEIAPFIRHGPGQVAGRDMLVVVEAQVLAEIDQGPAAIRPLVLIFGWRIGRGFPVDRADRVDLASDEIVERIGFGDGEGGEGQGGRCGIGIVRLALDPEFDDHLVFVVQHLRIVLVKFTFAIGRGVAGGRVFADLGLVDRSCVVRIEEYTVRYDQDPVVQPLGHLEFGGRR